MSSDKNFKEFDNDICHHCGCRHCSACIMEGANRNSNMQTGHVNRNEHHDGPHSSALYAGDHCCSSSAARTAKIRNHRHSRRMHPYARCNTSTNTTLQNNLKSEQTWCPSFDIPAVVDYSSQMLTSRIRSKLMDVSRLEQVLCLPNHTTKSEKAENTTEASTEISPELDNYLTKATENIQEIRTPMDIFEEFNAKYYKAMNENDEKYKEKDDSDDE